MGKYKAVSLTTPPVKILEDNDDEMKIVLECPNCGQATQCGRMRMISGYVGCDNVLSDGKTKCYFSDLMPRVIEYKEQPEGTKKRQAYINGEVYRKHIEKGD